MLSKSVTEKIIQEYSNKALVVEGANGSLGISLARVLKNIGVKPSKLILTTFSSDLLSEWTDVAVHIELLKVSDSDFLKKRDNEISKIKTPINVIYGAGYGRPNFFLKNQSGVLEANINNLIGYASYHKITNFCYFSTSEIYSVMKGEVSEDSCTISSTQHSRSVYIESKRLGEAITKNIISNNVARAASYRIALATPPRIIESDNRVLADLINSAKKLGYVNLKGGGELVRQYQYGPNAIYKILGSIVNGESTLYNNSGSHLLTLKQLAECIAKILNVSCVIDEVNNDKTSPPSVILDSKLINKDSTYQHANEKSFEFYLREIICSK